MNFLISQFVDYHARHAPDSEAICFLEEKLTYAELSVASNRLANNLLAQGVKRGDRVGIYMNKCLQTPIALYGIMKAGAAYVPLDPTAPATRTAKIVDDCGIKVLVSANDKKRLLRLITAQLPQDLLIVGPDSSVDLAATVVPWETVLGSSSSEKPEVKVIENDLAYIMYTSGSTGQPKGIMHTHHSGLSFAHWAVAEYGLRVDDRLSNHAPLHFDLSILDYFAGVVAGCCTVIIPEEYTKLPASYSQLLADSKVSILYAVPFALVQLLLRGVLQERDLSALRWVIFGGEPMPVKYLCELMEQLPDATFDNIYGPAEINGVTHYTVSEISESALAIPIGPIGQTAEALIVDEHMEPVIEGETGELWVRTPTMMQGYWKRPDLNRAAFQVFSREDEIQATYYRTGDLVSCDSLGMLWFKGRKDRQVKVRGYRIELDEVETSLAAHFAVEEAAIFTAPKDESQLEIYGAVRLDEGSDITTSDLFEYLKTRIPGYAVPGTLVLRDQFPRTTTGKIDRLALSLEITA